MIELLRLTNPVVRSFVVSLLQDAQIPHIVADTHMSSLEGSINTFPVRILVAQDDYEDAYQLLADAGVPVQ